MDDRSGRSAGGWLTWTPRRPLRSRRKAVRIGAENLARGRLSRQAASEQVSKRFLADRLELPRKLRARGRVDLAAEQGSAGAMGQRRNRQLERGIFISQREKVRRGRFRSCGSRLRQRHRGQWHAAGPPRHQVTPIMPSIEEGHPVVDRPSQQIISICHPMVYGLPGVRPHVNIDRRLPDVRLLALKDHHEIHVRPFMCHTSSYRPDEHDGVDCGRTTGRGNEPVDPISSAVARPAANSAHDRASRRVGELRYPQVAVHPSLTVQGGRFTSPAAAST